VLGFKCRRQDLVSRPGRQRKIESGGDMGGYDPSNRLVTHNPKTRSS
jgi:hypothetical protein